jgi:hypothetical protein
MVPKFDYLVKYWGVKKCTLAKLGLVINNIFWNLLTNMYKMKSCMCAKGLKMLLFNLRMEGKLEKYIFIVYYIVAFVKTRAPHDGFWSLQVSF